MASLLKRSLEVKIVLVLGLVLLGLLTVSSAVDLTLEARDAYGLAARQLDVLADTIQNGLIKDMRDGRSADVQQILESVGTEKGIISVRIFGEDGRILASSKRIETGLLMPAKVVSSYRAGERSLMGYEDGQRVFRVIHPILNAPDCYRCHGNAAEVNGVLALDYSLETVESSVYYHRLRLFILQVATIAAAGLVIYLLLIKFVTGPIKDIEAKMSEAETGNLDLYMPISSGDEIGALQRSFNNMLARIKELNIRTVRQERDLVKKEQEIEFQRSLEEKNRALAAAHDEALLKNRYYMEMLSFISHELKNPLLVLKGYLGLFLKGDLGYLTGQQVEALRAMERNVEALAEMMANYLGLSRIERGELKPEKKQIDLLEDVIRPVMQEYAETLEKASMGMRIEGADEPARLAADPGLIKSVLGNLVSNAVKYGREGRDIIISVGRDGGMARVSVWGEGGGIPPGDLDRVFERFTRLDSEEVRRKKGSGLGLYIVKTIVEMHGGTVRAESGGGAGAGVNFAVRAGTSGE